MRFLIPLLTTCLLAATATAAIPVKHLNEGTLYLLGRGSDLHRFAGDLVKLTQTTRLQGRLLVADLRDMRYPLQRLQNAESAANVRELETAAALRAEAGVIVDVLFPHLSWTRYQAILNDLSRWASTQSRVRRVWRVEPRAPGAHHALWLVDRESGYALVLRLP